MRNFTFLFLLVGLVISFSAFSQSQPENGSDIKNEKDSLYVAVEQQPEFKGGLDAMMNYLRTSIQYPAAARKAGKQGMVFVEFVIETEGNITNVSIVKGITPELNEEAMRVIKLMPPWIPGKVNGKPARVRFVLPVNFALKK